MFTIHILLCHAKFFFHVSRYRLSGTVEEKETEGDYASGWGGVQKTRDLGEVFLRREKKVLRRTTKKRQ